MRKLIITIAKAKSDGHGTPSLLLLDDVDRPCSSMNCNFANLPQSLGRIIELMSSRASHPIGGHVLRLQPLDFLLPHLLLDLLEGQYSQ